MSRFALAASGRRGLHPGAWWLWAACMAGAASRTTNPILLLLIAGVVVYVVAARRTTAPWSRSIVVFIRLGLLVIVLRVLLVIVFGIRLPGHVLFTLPHVPLPSWAAGVSIGGPVTAEAIIGAALQGLRLAVVLVCFGAANSLASPYRLLRCLPAVLYEAGVASPCRSPSRPNSSWPSAMCGPPVVYVGGPLGVCPACVARGYPCSSGPSTGHSSWRRPWMPEDTADEYR